ncbi:hypothetical protein AARAC_011160 [Aspergillus arachidicola]|uniref:Uncharacterized protein n=1 Tax=Aspergillus arachidicola TaxID=656916 RepID=A0A2G7G8G7_9EURO|nr:hypothetical protein AARAC_011160 [Aspergillus arachidicola]
MTYHPLWHPLSPKAWVAKPMPYVSKMINQQPGIEIDPSGDNSESLEMGEGEEQRRVNGVEMETMGSESGGGAKEEKSKSPVVHVPGNTEALPEGLPTENSERIPKVW